ncbi:unnamed protein product [Trichogramma brassicae]|uniref:Uncharacterized protein n=1 Tax=Trichogramma brassicae TaxID=86971 RepID=A0A6H5J1C8_9HYME|nr:unnamed protein product [Trichogramma brassicae]
MEATSTIRASPCTIGLTTYESFAAWRSQIHYLRCAILQFRFCSGRQSSIEKIDDELTENTLLMPEAAHQTDDAIKANYPPILSLHGGNKTTSTYAPTCRSRNCASILREFPAELESDKKRPGPYSAMATSSHWPWRELDLDLWAPCICEPPPFPFLVASLLPRSAPSQFSRSRPGGLLEPTAAKPNACQACRCNVDTRGQWPALNVGLLPLNQTTKPGCGGVRATARPIPRASLRACHTASIAISTHYPL